MIKKVILLLVFFMFFNLGGVAFAQQLESDPQTMTAAEFEASLNYRQGEIVLHNNVATLNISDSFRYLGPEDAERVLVLAWGNPPGNKTLGMIFPQEFSPLSNEGWGIVVTYEEDGYVSDEDADSIDYDDLLQQMRAETAAANEERQKHGYGTVELIGWAAQPYYNKETHKLYWAKEIAFGGDPNHTLNYNIRILGRRGVLVLNAVSGADQLAMIKNDLQHVLAFTNFNQGHRYEDFDSSTDKVAAYGLAGLVAGGLAAKAGLFTKLFALLIAAKKFIIFIIIGLVVFIGGLLKRKKA